MARHTSGNQDSTIRHAEAHRDEDNVDSLVEIIEYLDGELDGALDDVIARNREVEELQEELREANQRADAAEHEAQHPHD